VSICVDVQPTDAVTEAALSSVADLFRSYYLAMNAERYSDAFGYLSDRRRRSLNFNTWAAKQRGTVYSAIHIIGAAPAGRNLSIKFTYLTTTPTSLRLNCVSWSLTRTVTIENLTMFLETPTVLTHKPCSQSETTLSQSPLTTT
jgi:hypothetical protein